MLYIHDTVSLCDTCYRHIPAFVFERDGMIWLRKKCSLHGEVESLVEKNAKFYYDLNCNIDPKAVILFEVTDKCQLECPHCYHLPDNKTQDKPLVDVLEQVNQFPKNSGLILAGAEPTLRSDILDLIKQLSTIPSHIAGAYKNLTMLTNGVRFSSVSFSESAFEAGLSKVLFGLNHSSYNGESVHDQQLKAIKNLLDVGYEIPYIAYTMETLDHIPDILSEIEKINHHNIWQFRIRCGSFIGRSSDSRRSYVSDTIECIENHVGKENITYIPGTDHNIYHVNLLWKGIKLRIIQWPDHNNIDMEELNMGPYCQFYGKPITNFVHQVIMRDAYKNMKLPLYDGVPHRYTVYGDKTYWKQSFSSPKLINEYDYTSNLLVKNKVSQF